MAESGVNGPGMKERIARMKLKPREINSRPRQRVAFPWQRAFMSAREAWGPELHNLARELAHGQVEYAADLMQEAEIRLWELDPSRFSVGDHELVKRELAVCMRQAARRERRHTSPKRRVSMEQAAEEKPLLGLLVEEVAQ